MSYELEKYKGRSSRHTCPSCGKQQSLALYIDEQGAPLHSSVGRCNSESSCGYHYTPKQYFQDNPDRKQEFKQSYTPPKPQPPKPLCYLDKKYLVDSISYASAFVQFLCRIVDRFSLESPTIERLMGDYLLGATKKGEVIFWQVDSKNKVRTGKIQGYDPKTGKRIKGERDMIDWVHSRLKRSAVLTEDWQLTQCLFGEHLLSKYPDKIVAVVEGEKNAILGSAVFPDYVWVATGGKSQLSIDKMKVLSGRTVIMFPDADGFDEWVIRSKAFTFCKSIAVSRLIEDSCTEQERAGGFDISDYLIRELLTTPIPEVKAMVQQECDMLLKLKEMNPAFQLLIDTLQLEEVA